MVSVISHIALFVPSLREAEEYYRELFDMELIGREALLEDGLWYALPPDKGWDDAEAAGIDLGMLALRRGAVVLALFPGNPQPGQLYLVGLNMAPGEIANIRGRLAAGTEIWEEGPTALTFRDRYGIVWQIYESGTKFRSSGVGQGRWLAL